MRPFSVFVSVLMAMVVSATASLRAEDRTISTDTSICETVSYGILYITTGTEKGTVNLTFTNTANVTVASTLRMRNGENMQTDNLIINGGKLNLTVTIGPYTGYPLKYNLVGHYPNATGTTSGYEHTFINNFADFLTAVNEGTDYKPDMRQARRTQFVCDKVLESKRTEKRVKLL